MAGWMEKLLSVDLDTGSVEVKKLPQELLARYLGGRGLASRLLYDLPEDVDPLGPENAVVLANGPLTATRAPSAGRSTLAAISPLTGTLCDSSAGGALGAALKRAGYDALIVKGSAAVPCYVQVDGTRVEVCEAPDLWGQDTRKASIGLQELGGPGSRTACIGPAGEHQVRFASVCVDGRRFFGRGGLGAVWGAKKLKGIVVRGRAEVPLADPERFSFVAYECEKLLRANPITAQALPEFGTAVLMNLLHHAGALPAYNYRESGFAGAQDLAGEAITAHLLERRTACYRCAIACGRQTRAGGELGHGPEYESLWALGANLGLGDLELVAQLNNQCNLLGLDTISAGGTLSCAMELAETGLLPGGPRFGQGESLPGWLRRIAYREGEGDWLAEGSHRLAVHLGRPEAAMQARSMELPAYDPRGMQGQGLAYATSNRGGCHLRANMLGPEILGAPKLVDRHASAGKAGLVIVLQHSSAALDSLVLCKFNAFALGDEHFARLAAAATGVSYAAQDLQEAGERIWNLERLHNLRRGLGGASDLLPARLLAEPVREGPARGRVVKLGEMLVEYYRFRGWEADGVPGAAKLKSLGLEEEGRRAQTIPAHRAGPV